MDVVGGQEEMKAYREGKAQMASCAASGIANALGVGAGGCSGDQGVNALSGLATLNAAEQDHSIVIAIRFGSNAEGSPGTNGPTGPNTRTALIDKHHSSIGVNYTLPALVVHEVHESYNFMRAGHNTPVEGGYYSRFHPLAVRDAEDPALLGSGMPSRTARSCGIIFGRPAPFGSSSCAP